MGSPVHHPPALSLLTLASLRFCRQKRSIVRELSLPLALAFVGAALRMVFDSVARSPSRGLAKGGVNGRLKSTQRTRPTPPPPPRLSCVRRSA